MIDCCLEVEGRVVGSPKFYYESIDDPGIARFVRKTVGTGRTSGRRTAAERAAAERRPGWRYWVAPHLALVAYLRKRRDGGVTVVGELGERGEDMLSVSEIMRRLRVGDRGRILFHQRWRRLIRSRRPRSLGS